MKTIFYALVALCAMCVTAHADTCANAVKTGVYPCEVTLAWQDNSNNETNFIIERQLNGGAFAKQAGVGANVQSAVDSTVTQSPTVDNVYCWRVSAANVDSSGKPQQSGWSNTSCFTVAKAASPISPPAAPSGLTTAALSSTRIKVSWVDNSTDETKFVLTRKPTAGGKIVTRNLPANTESYTDRVKSKNTYCYQVRAGNAGGLSDYSNESCATAK